MIHYNNLDINVNDGAPLVLAQIIQPIINCRSEVRAEEKQTILDEHNSLRRALAKGAEQSIR